MRDRVAFVFYWLPESSGTKELESMLRQLEF